MKSNINQHGGHFDTVCICGKRKPTYLAYPITLPVNGDINLSAKRTNGGNKHRAPFMWAML
jgi:hypothetical protein